MMSDEANTAVTSAPSTDTSGKDKFGGKLTDDQVSLMQRVVGQLPGMKRQQPAVSEKTETTVQAGTETPEKQADATDTAEAKVETAAVAPESETEKQDTEDSKGWPDSAIKRNDKLRHQKKELETKLSEREGEMNTLKARIEELEQAKPEAPEAQAKIDSRLDSLEAVAERRSYLEDKRDLMAAYLHTGWESEDGKTQLSAEQIRAEWDGARAELKSLPALEKALTLRDTKYRPQLKERFEWWGKTADPLYAEARRVLKQLPELAGVPNAELLVASAVQFDALVESGRWQGGKLKAETAQAEKPKPKPAAQAADDRPPPVPGSSTVASGVHRSGGVPRPTAEELKGMRSGSRDGVTSVVKRMLAASAGSRM